MDRFEDMVNAYDFQNDTAYVMVDLRSLVWSLQRICQWLWRVRQLWLQQPGPTFPDWWKVAISTG